jgi:hypothetical protein
MYPHAGEKPVSNDKYIVGTYLHYVNANWYDCPQ